VPGNRAPLSFVAGNKKTKGHVLDKTRPFLSINKLAIIKIFTGIGMTLAARSPGYG
jgi:hypothetical protein